MNDLQNNRCSVRSNPVKLGQTTLKDCREKTQESQLRKLSGLVHFVHFGGYSADWFGFKPVKAMSGFDGVSPQR
jgi:hypothetical protein